MGQQLSNANSQIVDLTNVDGDTLISAEIVSETGQEDINLFLSIKVPPGSTNYEYQMSNSEKPLIKQIQNHLSLLTNVVAINTQNDTTFMANVLTSIITDYKRVIQEMKDILERQEQLKTSLTNKLEDQKQRKAESNDHQPSFVSKLSTLLKSAEKNISTVVHHLFEPAKHNVDESPLSADRITERQVTRILLNFSNATAVFKDVLPILDQLIFDTVDVYNERNVFIEMNNRFTAIRDEWEKEQINESECHSNSNAAASEQHNNTEQKQTTG
ncbi:unnamed protein product [Didymodactylos carnosus]|uniref:Uncharacterized protein n=1 Tax=Didymodactylos carnosus TaxID=1234261 RepID=A0A813ZHM4_9BILA|nr:unnamed protein product [Didymodactylos carnosus]CAF0899317.1 unnamed protein product [Didymodactylos carnosus]CAF3521865.1 unnamed protein product [Didymodactylos carnosus]CAF3682032.1 unnamed protein product [Didymodactylos carnosus]